VSVGSLSTELGCPHDVWISARSQNAFVSTLKQTSSSSAFAVPTAVPSPHRSRPPKPVKVQPDDQLDKSQRGCTSDVRLQHGPQLAKADTASQGASVGQPTEPFLYQQPASLNHQSSQTWSCDMPNPHPAAAGNVQWRPGNAASSKFKPRKFCLGGLHPLALARSGAARGADWRVRVPRYAAEMVELFPRQGLRSIQ
jgi:hypothetical protein